MCVFLYKILNYEIDAIDLPNETILFYEDISIWPIFWENFKYFVHNKRELGKAEILQYLLRSLEIL